MRIPLRTVFRLACAAGVGMSGLALIDSTGLGVLVGVMKRVLQHDGQMRLRAPRPAARKVFDITGLDRVFTIID